HEGSLDLRGAAPIAGRAPDRLGLRAWPREVLFIDPRVADAAFLLRSLRPGIEAVVLAAEVRSAGRLAASRTCPGAAGECLLVPVSSRRCARGKRACVDAPSRCRLAHRKPEPCPTRHAIVARPDQYRRPARRLHTPRRRAKPWVRRADPYRG